MQLVLDDREMRTVYVNGYMFQPSGEEVVLDWFFREFILLEIPPYPRRSDLPSSEESLSSRPLADPPAEAMPVDPRLLPLLGLANRLRGAADKE